MLLSIKSKITGQNSCSSRNLHTTTLKIEVLAIRFSSLSAVIILTFFFKDEIIAYLKFRFADKLKKTWEINVNLLAKPTSHSKSTKVSP